jgi:indole-3-glycerol phosphate synthase
LKTPRHLQQAEHAKFFAGVNTRNLRTLQVDPERLSELSSMLPGDMISVAESGLHQAEDAAWSASQGYGMALVGTALMRSDRPQELLSEMLAAGRSV